MLFMDDPLQTFKYIDFYQLPDNETSLDFFSISSSILQSLGVIKNDGTQILKKIFTFFSTKLKYPYTKTRDVIYGRLYG